MQIYVNIYIIFFISSSFVSNRNQFEKLLSNFSSIKIGE